MDITTTKLVSVIIPTYNRDSLLKEAIQSVVAQTYRPIECIIVDDGSIDRTKEVVESFSIATNDVFSIKYLIQKNAGSQVARNTGTSVASGEYIQYLDSDDLLYPDKIFKQVAYLEQNPDCDGVFGDWKMGTVENKENIKAYKSDDFIAQILTGRCIQTLSFLMRYSIVNKIGEWDVNIKRNQEIDFHLRGILQGGNFQYNPCNCGLWRIHNNERIINTTGLKEILESYQKWEKLLINKNLFDKNLRKKIADIYMWLLTQYEHSPKKHQLVLLHEIVRLDPEIEFYKNKKLVLLMRIIGKDSAFKIWLKRYYKIGDGQRFKSQKLPLTVI